MFVPAHNDRLMSSAARVDADVLLLDIEDSVQPAANKQVARDNILRYLADGRFRSRVLYPRVNDRESGELLRDVYQLTVEGIAGFMYPKSKKGEDIYFFGKLLETIEYEKGFPIGTFKIIPLIETTGGRRYEHTRDLQRLSEPRYGGRFRLRGFRHRSGRQARSRRTEYFYGAGPDRHGRQSMRGDSDRHGAYSRT